MAWDEEDWGRRRNEFEQHVLAKNMLAFRRINNNLNYETEATRRIVVVRHMMSCATLGSRDSPAGRREAYVESIFPFDWDAGEGRGAVLLDPQNKLPKKVKDGNGTSSCGTFIRGTWQLLGGGDDYSGTPEKRKFKTHIRQNYVAMEIFKSLAIWGYKCEALHGNYFDWSVWTGRVDEKGDKIYTQAPITGLPLKVSDVDDWDAGDVLFFEKDGGGRHIITLAGKLKRVLTQDGKDTDMWSGPTIEGGKGGSGDGLNGDAPCEGIMAVDRTIELIGGKLYLKSLGLPISWWVSFGKLEWTDAFYFVANRGLDHPDYKASGA